MKPIVVKSSTYFDFGVERNDKNPEFEEYQNSKLFVQKVTLQIGQKNLLLLKKTKKSCTMETCNRRP